MTYSSVSLVYLQEIAIHLTIIASLSVPTVQICQMYGDIVIISFKI